MFKAFFWKEWRQTYLVVALFPLAVIGINLYAVLKFHETQEFQRSVMCFFAWPGFALVLVLLLFHQESQKETMEFLFSKPIAKHALWLTKVGCGLTLILLMCATTFPGYFLVVRPLSNVSFKSALLDPFLLVGLCLTISVFSITSFCSTVSSERKRQLWSFGIVAGMTYFTFFLMMIASMTDPSYELIMERLGKNPIVFSLLILGISPLFFFVSFVTFCAPPQDVPAPLSASPQ